MIELERHIEILLLDNDCVIVPDFGGFMAHHVSGRYDSRDHVFLPPLRTIGYNPQLRINDSLLAQSYIEAYDISYPEAVQCISNDVSELKQRIADDGAYTLNGIGTIRLNDDGRYEFEPCEAGVLTPELYGLSSFEMRMAEDLRHDKPEKTEAYKDEDDEKTISIKVSVLRNIAAACIAAIAFFLFPSPTSTIQQPIAGNSLNTSLLLRIMPKDIITGQPVPVAVEKNKDATATPDCEVKEEKEEVKEPETKYTIVLASRVSTNNAEYFTGQLHKKGFDKARIITHKKNTHVVFGAYSTEAEAYNALRPLRQTESDFAEAWVMKVQE